MKKQNVKSSLQSQGFGLGTSSKNSNLGGMSNTQNTSQQVYVTQTANPSSSSTRPLQSLSENKRNSSNVKVLNSAFPGSSSGNKVTTSNYFSNPTYGSSTNYFSSSSGKNILLSNVETLTEQPTMSYPSSNIKTEVVTSSYKTTSFPTKSVFDKKNEAKIINLSDFPRVGESNSLSKAYTSGGFTQTKYETKPAMKILNLADLPSMTVGNNFGGTSLRESNVSTSTQKSSVVKTLNIFDLQELNPKEKKVLEMGKKLKKEKLIISHDGNVKKEDNETTLMMKSMKILEEKKEESMEEETEEAIDQDESELQLEGEIQNEIEAKAGEIEDEDEDEVEEDEVIEAVFDDYMKNYETNNSMEEMGIINEYKETILKNFLEERNKGDTSMISDRNISFTETQNKSLNEDLKKKLEEFPTFLKDAEEKGVLEQLINKKKEELEEKRESRKMNFVKKPTQEEIIVETVTTDVNPTNTSCTYVVNVEEPNEVTIENTEQPKIEEVITLQETLIETTQVKKPTICVMEVDTRTGEQTTTMKEETPLVEVCTMERTIQPEPEPTVCVMEVQVPEENEETRKEENTETLMVNQKEEEAQVSHKLIIIKEENGNEEIVEEDTQGMELAFNKRTQAAPQVMSHQITLKNKDNEEETIVVQCNQNEKSFEHKMENLDDYIQDAKDEGFFDELIAEKRQNDLKRFRSETKEEKKRMILTNNQNQEEEEEEVKRTMVQRLNNQEELDVEDVAENMDDYVKDALDNGFAQDLADKRKENQATKRFVNPLADKSKHNEAFTFNEIRNQMIKDAKIQPEVRHPEPVKVRKPVLKPSTIVEKPESDIEFSDAFDSDNEESKNKTQTRTVETRRQERVQVSNPVQSSQMTDRELDSFSRKRYGDQKDFNLSRTRLNNSNKVSGNSSRVKLGQSSNGGVNRTSVGIRSNQNRTYNNYNNRTMTSNQNGRVIRNAGNLNESELRTSRIGGQYTKDIYQQFENVKEMKPIQYESNSGKSKITLNSWSGKSRVQTLNANYRSPTQTNTSKTYKSTLAGRTVQTRNLQTPIQDSDLNEKKKVGTLKSILQSNLNPSHTEKKYSSYNPSSLSSEKKNKISHVRTPSTRTGKKKINLSNYKSKNFVSSRNGSTARITENSSTKYQQGSGYKTSRNNQTSNGSNTRRVVTKTNTSSIGGNRVGESRRIESSTQRVGGNNRIQSSSTRVQKYTNRSHGVKTNGKRRIKL